MDIFFIIYGILNACIVVGLWTFAFTSDYSAMPYPNLNHLLKEILHLPKVWRIIATIAFTILFLPAICIYFSLIIVWSILMLIYLIILFNCEGEV